MKNDITVAGIIFAIGLTMAALTGAAEAGTCSCKITNQPLNPNASFGVCKTLNPTSYSPGPFTNAQQIAGACAQYCSQQLSSQNTQSLAAACCQIGTQNGTHVTAYSAFDATGVTLVRDYGPLTRASSSGGTATCPAGWLADPTGAPGLTTNGKCRKAAGTITFAPLPPNGTAVGSYGVVLGNTLYVWGNAANGGGAVSSSSGGGQTVCHL